LEGLTGALKTLDDIDARHTLPIRFQAENSARNRGLVGRIEAIAA
jgi:hypothetical protein